MKKFLAVILSVLLLTSLAACRVQNPNDPSHGIAPDINPEYEENGEMPVDIPIEEPENDNGVVPEEDLNLTPFSQTVSNEEFTLTLTADKSVYLSGEEIFCEGTLVPNEYPITVYGSSNLGGYSIEALTGDYFRRGEGGLVTTDELGVYNFDGEDMIYPLSKSGGWSADNPKAPFYDAFFADKAYTLPAGTYIITLHISYSTDENDIIDTRKNLEVQYPITVIDNGKLPAFMENLPEMGEYQTKVVAYFHDLDTSLTLSAEDALTVKNILDKELTFTQDASDCLFDVTLVIDSNDVYYYSTSCGSLKDTNENYCHLSYSDKQEMNRALRVLYESGDIAVDEPIDAPVDVDVPVEEPADVDMPIMSEIEIPDTPITIRFRNSDISATLSPEDSATIHEILIRADFTSEVSNCLFDITFVLDQSTVYDYSTGCGCLLEIFSYCHLDEAQKETVNRIVSNYSDVDVPIAE